MREQATGSIRTAVHLHQASVGSPRFRLWTECEVVKSIKPGLFVVLEGAPTSVLRGKGVGNAGVFAVSVRQKEHLRKRFNAIVRTVGSPWPKRSLSAGRHVRGSGITMPFSPRSSHGFSRRRAAVTWTLFPPPQHLDKVKVNRRLENYSRSPSARHREGWRKRRCVALLLALPTRCAPRPDPGSLPAAPQSTRLQWLCCLWLL